MSDTYRFKFRFLTADGQETGFLSKKGSFDGATLVLDKESIPVEVIPRAATRFNRLLLNVLQENGTVEPFAIAITSGNVRKLMSAINRTTSQRWAALRSEALTEQGKRYRSQECPYCDATVDMTEHPDSPQMFCPYCDAIVTWRVDGPVEEADLHTCDGCGLYARPREFTIMYFYFLLVVWGYRYQKVYRCNTCMRPEAWKMLAGNLPFILGVPVALTQIVRVYSGAGKAFAGLERANALARAGRTDDATSRYAEIEQRLHTCASVRYNHALAFVQANRFKEAAEQFRAALADCSNFYPAYQGLRASLEQLGAADELAALKQQWGE